MRDNLAAFLPVTQLIQVNVAVGYQAVRLAADGNTGQPPELEHPRVSRSGGYREASPAKP